MKGQAGQQGPACDASGWNLDLVGGGRGGAVYKHARSLGHPPTPAPIPVTRSPGPPALQRLPRLWCVPCACPSGLASHSRHHADSYARGCQPGLSCSCGPVCCSPHSPGPCLPLALPPGPELILHASGWDSWDLNPGSPAHSPGCWGQLGARAEELEMAWASGHL